MAPMVILMAGLILWPFVNAVLLSFTTRNIARQDVFVGLGNYIRLLSDTQFTSSIGNTVRFTVVSVALKLVVGMTIALLLNSKLPFRNVLSGIMLLPWIVPEVVTALTWRGIYDPIFGTLNPLLRSVGLIDRDIGWLSESGLALWSVIAVNIWKGIPFFTLLLLAGMKSIDKELYEAAEVDGANPVQRFFNITLPGLNYVMAVTVLLSTIQTFNSFGIIYLMTGGGPGGETRVYSILAYERALLQNRYGPGAAVSLATAPFLAIFIILLSRFMRQGVDRNTQASLGSRIAENANRVVPWVLAVVFLGLAVFTTLAGAGAAVLLISLAVTAVICLVLLLLARFAAVLSTRATPWLIIAGLVPFVLIATMSPPESVAASLGQAGLILAGVTVAGAVLYTLATYATRRLKAQSRERVGKVGRLLLLLPFIFFVLFPFYFVITTAFKSDAQIQQRVSLFWPQPWTLDQFNYLLTQTDYTLWFRNTVTVALDHHGVVGDVRGAGRLCAGTPEVPRRRGDDHDPADHLFVASFAVVHPHVSHPDGRGRDQFTHGVDPDVSHLPDAIRDMGDAGLLPRHSGRPGRGGDDRWREPVHRILPHHAAAGHAGIAGRHTDRIHQLMERVPVCVHLPDQRKADHAASRPAKAGLRRHLPVWPADGSLAHHVHPGGDHVYLRAALPGGRPDRRQREGLTPLKQP